MEEKELTGSESVKLINEMIYEAKGYSYETGIPVLVYGFSILLCSILSYLRDESLLSLPFAPFYLMIPVFIAQSFIQLKEERKKKVKTFTDEAIDHVWMAFFLSSIAAFSGFFAGENYIVITIILFLAGAATFLTGSIAKFRYNIIAGIICLMIAAVSFFFQNSNIYFLLGAASVLAWIIPGFILRSHFKRTHQHG